MQHQPPPQPSPQNTVATTEIISIRIGLGQIANPSEDLIKAISYLDKIILTFAQSLSTTQGPTS